MIMQYIGVRMNNLTRATWNGMVMLEGTYRCERGLHGETASSEEQWSLENEKRACQAAQHTAGNMQCYEHARFVLRHHFERHKWHNILRAFISSSMSSEQSSS